MTSILRRLTGQSGKGEVIVEDDRQPDGPYMLASLVYVSVVLLIGIPMWYTTCSITRYSLPDLTELQSKLADSRNSPPRLHLDISVIQLAKRETTDDDDEIEQSNDQQANYLRTNLPAKLDTNIENVTYTISWRVRRPTRDERIVFQTHQRQDSNTTNKPDQEALMALEENLVKIHKGSRFRLFLYLIEEPFYSAYCDPTRVHTYTINFERFVYICPSTLSPSNNNHEPLVTLIRGVLDETYANSIDPERARHILGTQMDLLMSMLPESDSRADLDSLPKLTNKIHRIFNKNVKDKFTELKEVVNVRLITQWMVDVLDEKFLNRLTRVVVSKVESNDTATPSIDTRELQLDKIGQLFHRFETRLDKHSSVSVHNVLCLVPDPRKPKLLVHGKFDKSPNLNIIEAHDTMSMMVVHDDRSLVLGLRAISRRVMGLSSVNLCANCLVRRDVFLNKWEIDAIMGAMIIAKLRSVLVSLGSITEQAGVMIPKDVSSMAKESHELALKSIESLDTKRTLESFRLASQAYELSELSFYNPALQDSSSFPNDLKYAIYSPLFFPLSLLFIKSIVQLLKFACRPRVANQKEKVN